MSKLAPMDQHLATINASLARTDERFAQLGCATYGRTRQISVHAPRTTLIDTDWDTVADFVDEPIDSQPIPSTVRRLSNPASSTAPAGMTPLGVAAVVPNGEYEAVAESHRRQNRTRNAPRSLLSFIAGLVAGIGITVGLSSAMNGGYRLQHDNAQGSAVMSWHTARPQMLESERAPLANSVPGHPASTAPRGAESPPESIGTQSSNSPTGGDNTVQQGPSRKLNVPPDAPRSQPSAGASKPVRSAVPQSTRRATRIRRTKSMENDNPY